MAYCTEDDVELYININQVPDIDEVIAAAMNTVDTFTKDIFESRELTVYTEVNRSNVAELPYATQSIDNIVAVPSQIEIPENLWDFEDGTIARLRFYTIAPYSFLIVGAEPYSDRYKHELRLNVTGTFGYPTTPFQVRTATALLAAYYISLAGFGELKSTATKLIGTAPDVQSLEVEGYRVSYRPTSEAAVTDSTGLVSIDRLLTPFKRTKRTRAN
jgi:hypothetical protein